MNERGQTTVLVLGMALIAFAVAGLAVDGTRAWLYRRTLQNAADAAALAGAAELDRGAYYSSGGRDVTLERDAATVASSWLARRDLAGNVRATPDRVVVEMRGQVRTTFLSLAGIRTIDVGVRADAAPIAGTP